jgi:acetyl-CoA carboxylase alpha subunit
MVPALVSKAPSGFMHQVVVPSAVCDNLGAFRTMKADDGGQSPGIARSSWMVIVPVCRSGISELTVGGSLAASRVPDRNGLQEFVLR